MTKWMVLALGVLLALGGAVSMWNGVDVIQSERGWTSVIAGAVTLAGGVVTCALFLVIRELQALRASLSMVLEGEPLPAPFPAEAAHAVEETPAVHASPVVAPVVAEHEPVAPQVHLHAPEPAAPAQPEPSPAESFDQIFPPVPVENPPAAPARDRFRFRASDAAVGLAAGAAAIGAFGRSRVSETEPSQPEEPHSHDVGEKPASEVHAQPETHTDVSSSAPVEVFSVSEEELQETAAALRGAVFEASAPETVLEPHNHEAHEEPVAETDASGEALAEEPPTAEVDEAKVSPGYAWLERALAREEGQKSPALEWLRSRPPTSLLVDPAAPVHEPLAEVALVAPEEPSVEPPHAAEGEAEHEIAHEAEQEPSAEAAVVGRYSSGGSEYTLYSDGSIDAQTEQGLFRFESMAELRAYIEEQNNQS